MLAKELRESQTAIELPAREMMDNFSLVGIFQQNNSLQVGLINVQAGQLNAAVVTVVQAD
jgi:hypothetical protein